MKNKTPLQARGSARAPHMSQLPSSMEKTNKHGAKTLVGSTQAHCTKSRTHAQHNTTQRIHAQTQTTRTTSQSQGPGTLWSVPAVAGAKGGWHRRAEGTVPRSARPARALVPGTTRRTSPAQPGKRKAMKWRRRGWVEFSGRKGEALPYKLTGNASVQGSVNAPTPLLPLLPLPPQQK
jgi:hypothetical protein